MHRSNSSFELMSTQTFGAQLVSRNDVITLVITERMNVYKSSTPTNLAVAIKKKNRNSNGRNGTDARESEEGGRKEKRDD